MSDVVGMDREQVAFIPRPGRFANDLEDRTKFRSEPLAFDAIVDHFVGQHDFAGLAGYASETDRLELTHDQRGLFPTESFRDFKAACREWIDSVARAASADDRVKAVAVMMDSSMEIFVDAFLCDRTEQEDEDWAAGFVGDVRGPELGPLLKPLFHLEDRGVAWQTMKLRIISEIGFAVTANPEFGVPVAWFSDDGYAAHYLRSA